MQCLDNAHGSAVVPPPCPGPGPCRSPLGLQLRAGFIGLNGTVGYGADTPFGGYKDSGVGRQNGLVGFSQYTEGKSVAYPAT